MSSAVLENAVISEFPYRTVNGDGIRLYEKRKVCHSNANSVIQFVVKNEKSLNVGTGLLLVLVALFLWYTCGSLILTFVSVIAVLLHCKSYITAVDTDTLLVIESVGVHIASKKVFRGFDSCEFLPWDIVHNIFINEVIKGQKVLYYLTFVVKEPAGGKELTRLVPLFPDLIPEKKCLVYINPKEFTYGRELMKIIRNIIKCQPRQGQQFCTKHLLVSYNHTFWTRQDKMFAVLKFQERPDAAAYSRAFVLTVKVFPSPEKTIIRDNPSASNVEDLSSLSSGERETDASSRHRSTSENKGEKIEIVTLENVLPETDTTRKSETNEHTSNTLHTRVNEDSNSHSSHRDTRHSVRVRSVSEAGTSRTQLQKSKSNAGKSRREQQKQRMDKTSSPAPKLSHKSNKESAQVDNEMELDLEDSPTKSPLEFNFKDTFHNDIQDDTKSITSNDMSDETAIDSANLPYQYLIEKEIESARNKARTSASSSNISEISAVSSPSGKAETRAESSKRETGNKENTLLHRPVKMQRDNRQYSIGTSEAPHAKANKTDCKQTHGKESERKLVPDKKTLRSSNITDLVMEGLMFTIRQDKDSVAVIEQKTKLEVDEVLENSEKAETKEGERCLLNSSLLRLENLITRIDVPEEVEKRDDRGNKGCSNSSFADSHPLYHIIGDSHDYEYHNITDTQDVCVYKENHCMDVSNDGTESSKLLKWAQSVPLSSYLTSSDPLSVDEMNEMSIEQLEDDDIEQMEEDKEKEDEETEEDIIPEVLQCKIFQPSDARIASKCKQLVAKGSINRDLLMDDMDIEEIKHENSAPSNSLKLSSLPNVTETVPGRSKKDVKQYAKNVSYKITPRIVSDQIITMDEMPVPLQEALRNRFRKDRILSDSDNECEKKTHSTHLFENNSRPEAASSATQLRVLPANSKNMDLEILSSERSSGNLKEANDGSHCTVKKRLFHQSKDLRKSEEQMRSKEGEGTGSSSKEDTPSSHALDAKPNKLVDITEDFHRDLLHLQKKERATEQRCLRQRKRSSNVAEAKNGEPRVDMLKLVQDITRGAKVVVQRISSKDISNILGRNSSVKT